MHSSALRRSSGRLPHLAGTGLLLLLLGAVLASALPGCSGSRYEKQGPLHCVRDGQYLYTFDSIWRMESLHVVDPRTGIAARAEGPGLDADRVARMRGTLLRTLGLADLGAVPREGTSELEALRSLGYL